MKNGVQSTYGISAPTATAGSVLAPRKAGAVFPDRGEPRRPRPSPPRDPAAPAAPAGPRGVPPPVSAGRRRRTPPPPTRAARGRSPRPGGVGNMDHRPPGPRRRDPERGVSGRSGRSADQQRQVEPLALHPGGEALHFGERRRDEPREADQPRPGVAGGFQDPLRRHHQRRGPPRGIRCRRARFPRCSCRCRGHPPSRWASTTPPRRPPAAPIPSSPIPSSM